MKQKTHTQIPNIFLTCSRLKVSLDYGSLKFKHSFFPFPVIIYKMYRFTHLTITFKIICFLKQITFIYLEIYFTVVTEYFMPYMKCQGSFGLLTEMSLK